MAFVWLIYRHLTIFNGNRFIDMDYVGEIATVNQATDGADIQAMVKAGTIELLIRYFIVWR